MTYRRHSCLSLKPSPNSIVDTLGLAPVCVDTFVGIALVPVEALRAYKACSQRPELENGFIVILLLRKGISYGAQDGLPSCGGGI